MTRPPDLSPYILYLSGLVNQAVPDCDHSIEFTHFIPADGSEETFGARHGEDAPFQQVLDISRVMQDDDYGRQMATEFGRAVTAYVLACHRDNEFGGQG